MNMINKRSGGGLQRENLREVKNTFVRLKMKKYGGKNKGKKTEIVERKWNHVS